MHPEQVLSAVAKGLAELAVIVKEI